MSRVRIASPAPFFYRNGSGLRSGHVVAVADGGGAGVDHTAVGDFGSDGGIAGSRIERFRDAAFDEPVRVGKSRAEIGGAAAGVVHKSRAVGKDAFVGRITAGVSAGGGE